MVLLLWHLLFLGSWHLLIEKKPEFVKYSGEKETSISKAEWTKIYNAQNIVETEQLVEMLKQNGIAAFSQEAGANVAMHGAPGFGIYGVDIFVKTDDAEKAVQLIKEINNQE